MTISKDSKELIKGYIQVLKDRKKELSSAMSDVTKELDNIQKRKTQLQSQIDGIDKSLSNFNTDISDGGIVI